MNFLKDKSGFVAVATAILMPAIIALVYLAYDGGNILIKHSKLDDANREANLASTLSSQDSDKKQDIANKFLNYFIGTEAQTKEISEIEQKDKDTTQKGQYLKSSLESKTILYPFKDQEQDYTLNTESRVLKGGGDGGYTDYVFAIDFTGSMLDKNQNLDYSQIDKDCSDATVESDELDTALCNELKSAQSTLEITQAIVKKTLKSLAKYHSDTVQYSIIPLAGVSQISREYDVVFSKGAGMQLVTPYVLNSQYKLRDMREYDTYLRKFDSIELTTRGWELVNNNPTSAKEKGNIRKINNLITDLYSGRGAYSEQFEAYLNKEIQEKNIVDIQASINSMADLNAGFGFNLSQSDTDNIALFFRNQPQEINKKTVYNKFKNRQRLLAADPSNVRAEYTITYLASETPLKKLNKITSYKVDDDEYIKDRNDIITLNSNTVQDSKIITSGIMRAAGYLSRGQNSNKVLVLLTDGGTKNGKDNGIEKMDRKFIIENGLCDSIRAMLTKDKDTQVKIISIIVGDERNNRDFKRLMLSCTNNENIIFANDIKSFFTNFINTTKGDGIGKTKFTYEKEDEK